MIFDKIRAKNILSYGNSWTEINLNNSLSNLIVGTNGTGKSSIIADAVFYALTGKPYREIKKQKLINTTNKKNLVVELYLHDYQNQYKVVRGIKPDVFEIYKNDELIEESARSLDYQQLLERMLNFDQKTLRHTVFVSSSFYTPFLRLKTPEKREFVEKILNIEIFSEMRDILKVKNTVLKEDIINNTKDFERIESNIRIIDDMNEKRSKQNELDKLNLEDEHKRNILSVETSTQEKLKEIDDDEAKKIKEIELNSDDKKKELENKKDSDLREENLQYTLQCDSNLSEYQKDVESTSKSFESKKIYLKETLAGSIEKIKNHEKNLAELVEKSDRIKKEISYRKESITKLDDYKEKLWKITEKINNLNEERKFFLQNSTCPQCKQDITEEYVSEINDDFDLKIKNLEEKKEKGSSLVTKMEQKKKEISDFEKEFGQLSNQIIKIEKELSDSKWLKESQEKELKNLDNEKEKELTSKKSSYDNIVAMTEKSHNDKIKSIDDNFNETIKHLKNAKQLKQELGESITQRKNDVIDAKKQRLSDIEKSYHKRKLELENLVLECKDDLENELIDAEDVKIKLTNTQRHYKIIAQILSDKGIKTYIVRKYIPVLNKYVNEYLDILQAKYRIMFDENLDEKIAFRGYESLSYHSFSAGERQRCDMALLFSFLKLAKLKDSGQNTNLLVLDEIADSSMDEIGIDGLVSILDQLKREGNTIFTISHRGIEQKFDKIFTVIKKTFSEIKEM